MRAAGVDGRVRGGERAEQLGERAVLLVVEVVLAAQEDDLVLEDGRTKLFDLDRREVARELQPVDAGADPAAEAVDDGVGDVLAVDVDGGHGGPPER